ncbi:hypothetical protein BT69DRAFT_594992 [Atractiella rhizophila]|nr:hypothetical protein BT69DRAFT_594992 [Atractiella rhizophila]
MKTAENSHQRAFLRFDVCLTSTQNPPIYLPIKFQAHVNIVVISYLSASSLPTNAVPDTTPHTSSNNPPNLSNISGTNILISGMSEHHVKVWSTKIPVCAYRGSTADKLNSTRTLVDSITTRGDPFVILPYYEQPSTTTTLLGPFQPASEQHRD